MMKIDLHVHSKYSVRPSQWILQKLGCPECFTEPAEVYRIARQKGMDLVTITDHNTISGSAEIAHLPGTFISEEITTYFPDDYCKAHVLVYNINDRIHREVQRLRENIFDLVRYLDEAGIVHVLAHPLFSVNDKLTMEHFEKFLLLFSNFELNGARDDYQNQAIRLILENLTPQIIEQLIDKHRITPFSPEPWLKSLTGGSDDHSSLNIARQHTSVEGARNLDDFLLGIDGRRTTPIGHGSTPQVMSHNIYGIAYQYYKRKFNLKSDVNKDIVLRFLNRCLQEDPEADEKLFSRLIYSWRNRKAPKQQERPQIQDLLRFEAEKLLRNYPELMAAAQDDGNGATQDRSQQWFKFVNQISNNPGGAECGAELGQLGPGTLFGRLDFQVDDLAAGLGGLEQNFKLRVQRPRELAAIRLAATGGDGCHVAATGEEGLELGKGGRRLRQEVKTELDENRIFKSSVGAGKSSAGVAP